MTETKPQPPVEAFKAYGLKTPAWSLAGQSMWARLVDCYDGDTMTIVVSLPTGYYKFASRVLGIDTAEMKSKVVENKLSAQKARNRMLQLCGVDGIDINRLYTRKEVQTILADKVYMIWVNCSDFEKFGRLLIEPFSDPVTAANPAATFGAVLVSEKLAYPYYGETKLTETQQAETLGGNS